MANGINRVTLIGNLGRDPDVRYAQSGNAVCNLRLAIGERKREGEQWVDHTEWVDVSCFGKTAENAGQFLAKGRQVYVEGRLQTRKFTGKDGQEKWRTEVVASQVLFLGGGDGQRSSSRGEGRGKGSGGGKPPAGDGGPPEDDGFYDDDEGLPF